MLQIGRILINPSHVVKVLRDAKRKTTTVTQVDGVTSKFSEKYFEEAFTAFGGSTARYKAASRSSSRSRW